MEKSDTTFVELRTKMMVPKKIVDWVERYPPTAMHDRTTQIFDKKFADLGWISSNW